MKPVTLLLNLVLLYRVSKAAVVSTPKEYFSFKGLDGILRDYEIVKPEIVDLVNGAEFALNGTIQEYVAAAKELDPEFDAEFVKNSVNRGAEVDLEKRYVTGKLCIPVAGQPWRRANTWYLQEGSKYLRAGNGHITQPGHTCGRISCSYDAAIWMCNDGNTYAPHLVSLANMADNVIGGCQNGPTGRSETGGQIFDSIGINLILRHDDTNGC